MDDFLKQQQLVEARKIQEKEKFRAGSKERLQKICSKKVDTTMIGAISAFENAMGEFINMLDEESKLAFMEAFEFARSKILDNGNTQKRNMAEEFKQYTIEWNRYQIMMPVKPRTQEGQ